ncbi:MAG TPA: hypothetical protein VH722_03025 [Alphaproteobacteria bacterium]|nr:hypothetical protein [Alphaproteobacteria bacterium]
MYRAVFVLFSAVVVAGLGNVAVADTPANALVAQDAAKPLTISAAKQQVDAWLGSTGHSALHAQRAEFDNDGNVKVEVVDGSGIPYTHVLVHAADGKITNARAGGSSNKG